MKSPRIMAYTAIVGVIFGTFMMVEWIPRREASKSPIVEGRVTARVPVTQWGVPRVEYSIELPSKNANVRAHTQRYLLDQIPNQVRFDYTGDPQQEVYLHEHEENPLWIWLFCWAASAVLGVLSFYQWRKLRAKASGAEPTTEAVRGKAV